MSRTDTLHAPSELTFRERRQKINKEKGPADLDVGCDGKGGSRWTEQL